MATAKRIVEGMGAVADVEPASPVFDLLEEVLQQLDSAERTTENESKETAWQRRRLEQDVNEYRNLAQESLAIPERLNYLTADLQKLRAPFVAAARAQPVERERTAAPSGVPPEQRPSTANVPPHNLDAERAVLGGLLLGNEAFDVVQRTLKPEDFYSHANGSIYRAMTQMRERGAALDPVTLTAELDNQGLFQAVGGHDYLLSLTDTIPVREHIIDHARIVREKASVRTVLEAAEALVHRGYTPSYGQGDGIGFVAHAEKLREGIEGMLATQASLQPAQEAIKKVRTALVQNAREVGLNERQMADRQRALGLVEATQTLVEPARELEAAQAAPEKGKVDVASTKEAPAQETSVPDTAPSLTELVATAHAQSPRSPATRDDAPAAAFDTFGSISGSHKRVDTLAQETAAARLRDTERHREEGKPFQEPEPNRREILEAATRPKGYDGVAELYRPSLVSLDLKVTKIRDDIINNPMWINSAFLARTKRAQARSSLLEDRTAQKKHVELARAAEQIKGAKAQHERDLKLSQSAIDKLESYLRQPGWLRWIQDAALDREAKLTEVAEQRAAVEHQSQRNSAEMERRGNELYKHHCEMVTAELSGVRQGALDRRSEIEQPLREALLERYSAERAIVNRAQPLMMRDALEGEKLTLQSVRTLGGFAEIAEFKTGSGHTLLVDLADHKEELGKVAIGDKLVVGRTEHGSQRLVVTERSNVWSHQDRVEGRVLSVQREGDKVRGVELEDARGARKWLLPLQGEDLRRDFGTAREAFANLGAGDMVAIHSSHRGRNLDVLSRAPELSRGR